LVVTLQLTGGAPVVRNTRCSCCNHSALFLAFILALVKLAGWLPALGGLSTAGIWVLCCYSPWYVYAAMRRFYGQGRLLTLAKLGFMLIAYFASLLLTLVITALVSVLQA
jgi:hypothetical protein